MGINKDSRYGSLLISIGAFLVRWIMRLLGKTWRIEVVAGSEHLDRVLASDRPVILSFWHNRSFANTAFFFGRLLAGGLRMTLLASQSRDGELVTRICRPWGVPTVRGSASRGGSQALRALHRSITREGSSPIMIPDGPRGPLYHFKLGVVVLAQTSKAPILPIGVAASRFWTLGSWDRMIVPRPFARIAIAIGEPQPVPREFPRDQLDDARERLEEKLTALTRQAEAAVGAKDPALEG